MRILGIDYGNRKIGLAFGESTARTAVPLNVIANDPKTIIAQLTKQIVDEDIDHVVVGVPLPQGNHSSVQLEKTRAFIQELAQAVSVPVTEEDESFTSVESVRIQQEWGTQTPEDALSAMLIVQSFIDHL